MLMDHFKFKKNSNSGFSLIELVVAVAIASIIVLAIGSVLIFSSRSYSSTSTESGLQSDAQIVMNQIQDLVIDAKDSIQYTYKLSAADVEHSAVRDSDIPSGALIKTLLIYNRNSSTNLYDVYEIQWNGNDKQIYYCQCTSADEKPASRVEDASTKEALAENTITGFACDLTHIEDKRILQVDLDIEKGTKTYHASNNISIRNKVTISANTLSVNASVSVNDFTLNAEPGMTLPLAGNRVVVTGNATAEINYLKFSNGASDDSGRTSSGTQVSDDGKSIVIAQDERASQIKIHAQSKSDPAKEGFMYININRVYWTDDTAKDMGLSATPDSKEGLAVTGPDEIMAGTSETYTAAVLGKNAFSGTDTAKLMKVKGTITKGADIASFDESTGLLTVDASAVTKVTADAVELTFTASHSLADGGLSIRTLPYPGSKGVYKTIKITVKPSKTPTIHSNIVRGAVILQYGNIVDNMDYNANWKGLYWRVAATRPVMNGKYYYDYPSEKTPWNYTAAYYESDVAWETCSRGNGGTGDNVTYGWNYAGEGGTNGRIQSSVFSSLLLSNDYMIQFKVVVCNDGSNANKVTDQTSIGTFYMHGLRTLASNNGSTETISSCDLGTYYRLQGLQKDTELTTKAKITQQYVCVDNQVFKLDSNMKWYVSKTYGGSTDTNQITVQTTGYTDQDHDYNDKQNGADNYQTAVYKSMLATIRVRQWSSISDGKYYIWPEFFYNNGSVTDDNPRPAGNFTLTLKTGNINLNGTSGFVPYPAHGSVAACSDYWGTTSMSDAYTDLGVKTIVTGRDNDNPSNTSSSAYKHIDKQCYMKVVNDKVYLYVSGYGEYCYNSSTEDWESTGNSYDESLNAIVLTLTSSSYDVFIPYPSHPLFYGNAYSGSLNNTTWTKVGSHTIGTVTTPCWMKKDGSTYYLYLKGKGTYSCSATGKQWILKDSFNTKSTNCTIGITKVYIPTPDSPEFYEGFSSAGSSYIANSGNDFPIYYYSNATKSWYLQNSGTGSSVSYKKDSTYYYFKVTGSSTEYKFAINGGTKWQ